MNFGQRLASVTASLILFASTGFAVDGVVLIDQARVLAGNVTPGDAPGFPLTISVRGSYRLSGNLTLSDASTTAIQVTAQDVTIDLNGFSIIGPVACTGGSFNEPPLSCSGTGAGMGISGGNSVTVTNGIVRGMGNHGILVSENCRIEKVHLIGNGGNGLTSLNGCVLTENNAMRNGKNGFFGQSGTFLGNTAFANGESGFTCSNTCQISKSVVSFNGGAGIAAGGGSNVTSNSAFSNKIAGINVIGGVVMGNTVLNTDGVGIFSQSALVRDNLSRGNTGVGLQITIESGYGGNILQENNGGNASPQIQAGPGSRNLGQNVCGLALCP